MEQNTTWPAVISVQMITELRRAVKKLIGVDVAVPAFAISLSDASPSTCLTLTAVAPGGGRLCEPFTRSALELSAVRSIQKNGNRLTNSSRIIADQAATRPQAMLFLSRVRASARAPGTPAGRAPGGEMVFDMSAPLT